MRSTAPMRTAKIGYIAVSALMVLLGLALIIFPEISVSVLETVCGILFIVFGVIKLVGFFQKIFTAWPSNTTWCSAYS